MLHPLVSNLDCDEFESPEAIADAFLSSVGMSRSDQLARVIGHGDNCESDGQGACASFYDADSVVLRLFAVAAAADGPRGFVRLPFEPIHVDPRCDRMIRRGWGTFTWAPAVYVRNDDRGFWDAVVTTRGEADAWLAEWAEWNAPGYCDECDTETDPKEWGEPHACEN